MSSSSLPVALAGAASAGVSGMAVLVFEGVADSEINTRGTDSEGDTRGLGLGDRSSRSKKKPS
jgi:hypothetical protein